MDNAHDRRDLSASQSVSPELDLAIAARRAGEPVTQHLTVDERELLDSLTPWLRALKDATGPDREERSADAIRRTPVRTDDPIALMLGLVPSQETVVDGRKLAAARKVAKLNLLQLVKRLVERGWEVDTATAFAWEQGNLPVAPAIVNAIAEELHVSSEALLTRQGRVEPLAELFDDQSIVAFLDQWAHDIDTSASALRAECLSILATSGRRNSTIASVETLLKILGHLKDVPGFGQRR
jgi:hypothetical protein